jgi:chlorobactene glucosyltransferase
MWVLAALQCARLAWADYQRRAMPFFPARPVVDPGVAQPSVSIVVPARNEETNIGACLDAAVEQTYPDLQIVVVDDQSEDHTAEIVAAIARRDPRVVPVSGQPLLPGWKGKCWALHQGAQAARGDWLLFVDADTRLRPGAVAGAVTAAIGHDVPVLSALTHHELPTWWERIVQPAVITALSEGMPITFVNDPRKPAYALANGQFLLVRRDVYRGVGGHEAIKDEMAEDAQFAKRVKRLGYRFLLGDGRQLASTRMYTTPAALWEGWTKNLHTSVRLLPWLVPPGTLFYALSLVAPYWAFARAIRRRSPSYAAAGAIQLGAALATRRLMDWFLGVPARYTLTQPLGQVAFLTLLLASFAKVLSGRGVTWKGRRYAA